MNENLDLTKILDGCPKGTKLYSTLFGNVQFVGIDISDDEYPIKLQAYNKYTSSLEVLYYSKEGNPPCDYEGECTLFPDKNQRDWSKFERFWDKQKSKELNKETYSAKETTTVEKAADVFSEMLVELWPDLLGFGGIAKKLENEFRKRLEE